MMFLLLSLTGLMFRIITEHSNAFAVDLCDIVSLIVLDASVSFERGSKRFLIYLIENLVNNWAFYIIFVEM